MFQHRTIGLRKLSTYQFSIAQLQQLVIIFCFTTVSKYWRMHKRLCRDISHWRRKQLMVGGAKVIVDSFIKVVLGCLIH